MTTTLIERGAGEGLALREEQSPAQDLRHAMINLPVEDQNRVLAMYVERRNNFRQWLRSQFEEGLHFGTPPGCGPKGNPRQEQWQHKPSLYAAGADMLCDIMGLRAEFHADLEAWKQLGGKEGVFVMCCKLYSRATGELQSEGRGVRRDGQKGGDANNALKMAQKSAKVDAVLNCYGLRDLYGQDLDVPSQPPHDNPEQSGNQSKPAPRGQRNQPEPPAQSLQVTKEQCAFALAHWRADHPQADADVGTWNKKFHTYANWAAKREFDAGNAKNWTRADFVKVCEAVGCNPEDAPGWEVRDA